MTWELSMKVDFTRTQELELPREVAVGAVNTVNFESISEYERRFSGESSIKIDVDLPIPMPNDRAVMIARTTLYSAIAARNAYAVSTTRQHANIEPGDVGRIRTGSLYARVRVVKKEESDGVCKFETVGDLQTAWERDAELTFESAVGEGIGFNYGAAPVFAVIYDLPRVLQTDPVPLAYAAVFTEAADFKGAQLAIVDEAGNARQPIVATSLTAGGVCVTTLPQTQLSQDVIDEVSSVDVQMQTMSFIDPSKSPLYQISVGAGAPVYRGGVLAVVGQELVAFGRYEEITDGIVRFSKLRRCVLNTPGDLHSPYERFDVLKSLVRIPLLDTDVGMPRLLRVTPLNGTLDDAEIFPFTVKDGGTLGPFAPTAEPRVIADGVDLSEHETTSVRRPTIMGSGEPGDFVDVYPNYPGEPVARVLVGENGTWSHTLTQDLADGEYAAAFRYVRNKSSGPFTTGISPTFEYEVAPEAVPAGKFRYFRVNITANHGGAFVMINSCRFFDNDDARIPTIWYEGDRASADNFYAPASFTPAKAFDDDRGSFWGSMTAMPHWLQWDFVAETAVSRVELVNGEYPENQLKDFTIQGSNDLTAWTVLATVVDAASGPSYSVLDIDL